MNVVVHFFARARDLAGTAAVTVELPAQATVADLRRVLLERFPNLGTLLARSALAVNNEFADDAFKLSAEAEVALLPPVSGG